MRKTRIATAVLTVAAAAGIGVGPVSAASQAAVAAGTVAAGTVVPGTVASVSSLTATQVDCDGSTITAYTPPAGEGMPLAALSGDPDSADYTDEEAADFQWLIPQCAVGPPGSPISNPVTGSSVTGPDGTTATRVTMTNWSGFQVQDGTFSKVRGQWVVPAVSGTAEYSSIWPGIGSGDSAGHLLVQAGTEQDALSPSSNRYYAWFERYPRDRNQIFLTNLAPEPGDPIFVQVYHNGSGKAQIDFQDMDPQHPRGTIFDATWGSQYTIGKQSEWILERTQEGSNYPKLADVHTVTFTKVEGATSGSLTPLGNFNRQYIWMENCHNSTVLAQTGNISNSGTSFPVIWKAPGTSDPVSTC